MNTTLRHGTHDRLVTYMKVFEAHNTNNVGCLRLRGQIVQDMKSVCSWEKTENITTLRHRVYDRTIVHRKALNAHNAHNLGDIKS